MEINQQKTLDDIFEIVTFIKDNAVTKNEFETRLTEIKTEIMTHIDSFVVLHQKLDTELTALRSKYTRLEDHVQQLAKHLNFQLQ